MSCCARCGQGICSTAGKIALNKVWHKGCFCCYNCNRSLNVTNAKIYYGEVFCPCCCPNVEEIYPLKICRVSSTPSCNAECCPKPLCCASSETLQDCCRPRDVHSCSCIPSCCQQECEEPPKRVCRPRTPPCCARPPPCRSPPRRPCSPRRCPCPKCCPKKQTCPPEPCCRPARRRCPAAACCDLTPNKRRPHYQPCGNPQCKKCCCADRCRRCGEKVFAAEKVLTAYGAYHMGCFSCNCCCKSLCVKTMYEACGEIYCKQCYNNYFGVSGYGYSCC